MTALALYAEWDASFLEFLDKNGNLEDDKEKICNFISLLIKVTDNIIKNPMEEKYRKLKKTNAALNKSIFSLEGGERTISALGFTLLGELFVLEPSAEKWENLLRANNKLKSFLLRLNASSMITPSTSPNVSSNSSSSTTTITSPNTTTAANGVGTPDGLNVQEFMTFFQAAASQVTAGATSTSTNTTTTATTDAAATPTTASSENKDESEDKTEK